MDAILETAPVEKEKPGRVSRGARKAYQQSVFDGVCDPQINFDARRIDAEWQRDRKTYESRQAACKTLADVPRLEAVAADVARALAEAESFARSPLSDSVTVQQLRAKVRAVNPKVRVDTPAELADGLQWLVGDMPDGGVGGLGSRVIAARGAVADARTRAQQVLFQSAADAGPDHNTQSVQQQISELRRRIAERRPALDAERLIKEQKAKCEALAAGEVAVPPMPGLTVEGKNEWFKKTYCQARKRLDELMDLLADRQDAEAANAKDTAELQRLNEKLRTAGDARRARMFQVENMRWVE